VWQVFSESSRVWSRLIIEGETRAEKQMMHRQDSMDDGGGL
jgi:hypothetical protein